MGDSSVSVVAMYSQTAKTHRLTSIRHRFDTNMPVRCLIVVYSRVFAAWVMSETVALHHCNQSEACQGRNQPLQHPLHGLIYNRLWLHWHICWGVDETYIYSIMKSRNKKVHLIVFHPCRGLMPAAYDKANAEWLDPIITSIWPYTYSNMTAARQLSHVSWVC